MFRLTLTAVLLATLRAASSRAPPDNWPGSALIRSSAPSVAVINGVGFHTEVFCALLWSLVQANVNVSAHVLTSTTSGIEEVISGWWGQPPRVLTA